VGLAIAVGNVAAALPIEQARAATKPSTMAGGALRLKVLTVNVLFRVRNDEQILAQIATEQPDVVLFQELTPARASLLRRLQADYPWQAHCADAVARDVRWACDVAIVSRHPWETASAQSLGHDGAKMAAARFGADRGGLLVASIHLKWPLVSNQAAQLAAVRDALAGHQGPIIVGGDLNAVPWSAAVRGFTRESRLRSAGGFMPTWPRRTFVDGVRCALCLPQLQIDHVFVSDQVRVQSVRTGDDVGSDHLPLIAEVELFMRTAESDASPR
jgi:endonuclease/exonuclease/phosphatase (EEP) superfamily protein YafD